MTRGSILVAASYFALGFALWAHAWTGGGATHTLCGCGDPALFLWFFQAPATSVAHLQNPFYSTAMFHPVGINLLDQTSVLGITMPLIPVTWLFGPVASFNVASTLVPALTALTMFVALRRWVRWLPAAYIGGLLYGFSPFVLASLEYGHLMTAALMLLPLILAVLDEILVRQQHSARKAGVALGLLLFAQFFLSSELLAVVVLLTVFSVVVLVAAVYVADRPRLRLLVPHARRALGVGAVVAGVLLAYPVLFALTGPAHLSGVVWPDIDTLDGITRSLLVNPVPNLTLPVVAAYGGYEGSPLPSASYLGWGLIVVVIAGTAVWFRDRRLWFYGLLLGTCVVCSFDLRTGAWVPARFFAHVPLVENILPQRFMAVGFLAAAVMVSLILERARTALPERLGLRGLAGNLVGIFGALGVGAVALAPLAVNFLPELPFTMEAVVLPRWYTTVAPHLPPGRVLLSYPVAFSGIQVALAWQAVNRMAYSQAGGAGPEGTSARAGGAAPGFDVLNVLSLGFSMTEPNPTVANLAAVRHALGIWRVNTVVIAPEPLGLADQQGHDPAYAAAYMTAVLGRLPVVQAGAWVWDDVHVGPRSGTVSRVVTDALLQGCVSRHETTTSTGVVTASMGVPSCVAGHLWHGTAPS
ncbi:MAG: hypothetical protein ACLQRH_11480 [Acidimicrobiales bacterium]